MGIRGVAGGLFVLVFTIWWLRRHRLEGVFLGLVGIPVLLNILLRALIGRPRPSADIVEVIGGPQGFSFPSGTAVHAILFYGFLLYMASRYLSPGRQLYAIWAIGILYILFSGFWVIYNGRHWFTDVIGGYVYGSFYLLVLIALFWRVEVWLQTEKPAQFANAAPRFMRRPLQYALRIIM